MNRVRLLTYAVNGRTFAYVQSKKLQRHYPKSPNFRILGIRKLTIYAVNRKRRWDYAVVCSYYEP